MLVWSKASDVKTDFTFLKFSCHRSIKLLSACDVCQTWEPSWNLRLCWWNTLCCFLNRWTKNWRLISEVYNKNGTLWHCWCIPLLCFGKNNKTLLIFESFGKWNCYREVIEWASTRDGLNWGNGPSSHEWDWVSTSLFRRLINRHSIEIMFDRTLRRTLNSKICYWELSFSREITCFRREVDEICVLLGYYAAHGGNSLSTFRIKKSKIAWPLKMGPIGFPETSVRNYQHTLRFSSRRGQIAFLQLFTSVRKWKSVTDST